MRAQALKATLIVGTMLFSLSACSVFSPVKSDPTTTYLIKQTPEPEIKAPKASLNLLVNLPGANPIYNTTAIAYTKRPYEIAYFVKNSWVEAPAEMLQPLIIETLQNTHYFHSVGTVATIGNYNYLLNTQIVRLEQDFSKEPNMLRFVLRAQIIRSDTNQLIASKEFAVSEIMSQQDPYTGVLAANRAVAEALRQLAQFCLKMI